MCWGVSGCAFVAVKVLAEVGISVFVGGKPARRGERTGAHALGTPSDLSVLVVFHPCLVSLLLPSKTCPVWPITSFLDSFSQFFSFLSSQTRHSFLFLSFIISSHSVKMASATRQFARVATRTSTRSAFSVAPRHAFRQQGRRFYSSEPAQKSSSAWIWVAGLAAVGGAGYWYTSNGVPSAASTKVFTPGKEDYQKVYNEIAARLEEKDDYDDGSFGPVLLRLAWHASGTYDAETGTGGSNGATMRFAPESDHGANAGLAAARGFLDPVKEKFPWITYSDLWILAGVAAIQEMQGPIIPYRPGRSDRDVSGCTPDGRLPDATKSYGHLRDIFYRMGFNDQEIVALSGAHALGRCHTDRSGFTGPWTFSPTILTNDYYRLLIEEKWQWKKWNGPRQYEDKKTKTLMMLPTDMALVEDKKFKPWVEKYAKDNDLFFKDFSAVVLRLFELGVPFAAGTENQRWTFKPTWDEEK